MKSFNKFWWAVELLSCIVSILNPYVGVFGVFNLVTLFIALVSVIILYVFVKKYKVLKKEIIEEETSVSNLNFIKIIINILKIVCIVMQILFLVIKVFVNTIMFLAVSSTNKFMSNILVFTNVKLQGVTFCSLTIILGIIAAVMNYKYVKNLCASL